MSTLIWCKLILIFFISFSTHACKKKKSSGGQEAADIKTVLLGTNYRYDLGRQYNSLLGDIVGKGEFCVRSDASKSVFIPNPQATMYTSYHQSTDEEIYSLGISSEGKIKAGIVEAKAGAGVETNLIATGMNITTFSSFQYHAGNVVLVDHKIQENVKDYLDEIQAHSPIGNYNRADHKLGRLEARLKILRDCGDEFLYQAELGAKVVVGLEFVFHSVALRNRARWWVQVVLKFLRKKKKWGKEGKIDLPFPYVGAVAFINLIFYQKGGDPEAAKAVVGELPRGCYLKETEHSVAGNQVDPKNFIDCYNKYAELVEYAKTKFPEQLKEPVLRPGPDHSTAGLAVLRYHTIPYRQAGYPYLDVMNIFDELGIPQVMEVLEKIGLIYQFYHKIDRIVKTLKMVYKNAHVSLDAVKNLKGPVADLMGIEPDQFVNLSKSVADYIGLLEVQINSLGVELGKVKHFFLGTIFVAAALTDKNKLKIELDKVSKIFNDILQKMQSLGGLRPKNINDEIFKSIDQDLNSLQIKVSWPE